MRRAKRQRLYVRRQGGEARFYADFRDYSDVGGGREALRPVGTARATTDEHLAQTLLAQRLTALEAMRVRGHRNEPVHRVMLSAFAEYHLQLKRSSALFTEQWLDAAEGHLNTAREFFCQGSSRSTAATDDRALDTITVRDVQAFVHWLADRPNGRGGRLSTSSQRKCLNSLSNLFRRAISEGAIAPGRNPVAALLEKPQDRAARSEANWLEVPRAALLLDASKHYAMRRSHMAMPSGTLRAVIGTMLLTGGRPSEVLGLQVEDVSFERKLVTFRPNEIRGRLKTRGSHRSVPLWPQLAEILGDFLAARGQLVPGEPLFANAEGVSPVVDVRKGLDAVLARLGWPVGSVRPYAFRHTYCSARLQTLDGGAPVSPFTVARELGHGGLSLVNRVYGHLGEFRHRSEVVEYRIQSEADRAA